ncbi:MAG: hypothetical protein IKQ37_03790 [Bacteroidaceae bacterium]|nr:hypothetical protein [Bacteroidaceae bacterium]
MKLNIYNLLTLAACGLLLAFSSCKGGDDTIPGPSSSQGGMVGNKEKPAWQNPTDQDMPFSMTAIIRVNLSISYPQQMAAISESSLSGQIPGQNDLLAAFSGDKCLGVAQYIDGLFFLYIARPPQGADQAIDIYYYSATLKNIFVAQKACTFVADDCKGSVSAPLEPSFLKTD